MTSTDWSKLPRSEVERAAATGDPGAISALVIHGSLDRIEEHLRSISDGIADLRTRMLSELEDLRGSLKPLQRE